MAVKKIKIKEERNRISLFDIIKDETIHARAETNNEVVMELTMMVSRGEVPPPVVVFYDGEHYWLADGFYRYEAHILVGRGTIPAIIRQGGRKEAVMHAVGANASHGLRRTNEDKWKAVTIAFTDPDIQRMSDNQIAKICNVTQPFVGRVRGVLTYNGYKFETTRVCSDGRIMDVSGIGTKQETEPITALQEPPEVGDNNDEVTGPTENGDQENLEDQESNPETNVDTVPGDNYLGTGTQGDANVPPEPVDNNSETDGSEDGDEDDLDTEDNDLDSDDTTEPDAVEVNSLEPAGSANHDDKENLEDQENLGVDPENNTSDDEPEIDGDSGNTDGTTDPEVIVPPENDALDAIEDINTLKSMILELTTVKTNQEKEIEIKNNQIADLEKEVDGLKSENEYLKIQLQGRADSESEVTAFLDVNEMEYEEENEEEEEDIYSMA